ncbi:hypothetical protein [Streptomyces qinzhouensis]|uniref:DUF4241 domain-containing protein n=1 Tax=Streptomyces qinzhouensis TaxID=2599401 RepID=A0A5B8JE40_9ACTN|nr:hypothetical protein [Streptomyces qinzhouensis]QDY80025.1 hypothetical protein FQU76_29760 [Streptomyces qinzhouensis]
MERTGDVRLVAGPEDASYLEVVFVPGKHVGTVWNDPATPVVVTEIEEVAAARVPSGRLMVDAPWHDDEVREYELGLPTSPPREPAVRIPPGTYRIEIAWTAGPYEFFGERFDGVEYAAARLVISDDPVFGWEREAWASTTMSTGSGRRTSVSRPTPMSAASPMPPRGQPCRLPFARSLTASRHRVIRRRPGARSPGDGSATRHRS